ncbi:RNA-binding protein 5-A isoform X2 [Alosa pseudoharengus]|uniref:RNA-binding protein 5-A isoform X2 n=1 Tax=Alosa pseudoharengus TaxID=34774 RepID=UPI003F8A282D
MWNGPRSAPRGGPPFGGNPRGDMFEGRDGPMPDFRGRDGMNMGPRPQDRPPMDMRRFDGPPDIRGQDMDPRNMDLRGRDGPRDFFRQGEETDLTLRRRYEIEIRSKLQNAGSFPGGQGRHQMEMDGRDMPGGNMNDGRFMDMRERERMGMDMPGFNPMDQRRRHPGEQMGRNDGFRDMRDRDRPRMGMDDIDGFRMDMSQPDRGKMDFDRRGGMLSMNNRGRFESDMDMRSRVGPSGEFRDKDRDRSPLRFGDKDRMPVEGRGRPDGPPDPSRPSLRPGDTLRDREFPEPLDSSVGFKGRENESPSEEWRSNNNNNAKDKDSFPGLMNRGLPPFSREAQSERFFPGRGRDGRGEPFNMDRDRRSGEFPEKDEPFIGLPRPERDAKVPENFPGRNPLKSGLEQTFPPVNPALIGPNRDKDGKPWSRELDAQLDRSAPNLGRPPYTPDKSLMSVPNVENRFPNDRTPFKGLKDTPQPSSGRGILGPCPEGMQRNSGADRRDQDYRDIDYRTASGRAYDYNLSDLPGTEKDRKEPRLPPPQRSSNAGSQDQDYRSASVEDKVSNTISISGIPKTATMEQILGAFAVRDGVPMQGMKIKNVVPGYSFDMAYVEFLNLEDAVHFMESNQGSLRVGNTTALMKYVQPDRSAKDTKEPPRKPAQVPEDPTPARPSPQPKATPKPDEPRSKPAADPAPKTTWQRSSDLTPEAWQQQVDQQLQQQEAELKAEAWANSRNSSRHPPRDLDPVFKESKTMIIKNLKNTTTVEMILKALDPYAYLDERNVRLVRSKPNGCKCFCFVDMDSHEQVTRLVDMLTRARPVMVDGVRIYAEVAKPLKNQNSYKREYDKSGSSILGYPPEVLEHHQQMQQQQQYYQPQPLRGSMGGALPGVQGDMTLPGRDTAKTAATAIVQHAVGYPDASAVELPYQAPNPAVVAAAGTVAQGSASQHAEPYGFGADTPDLSAYLYDATSGFYYDPQTTLYYDPTSRYFYNAETQQYLYWDSASKTYIPVAGSTMDGQASNPVPALPGDISVPLASAAVPAAAAAPLAAAAAALPSVDENAQRALEDGDAAGRSDKKEKEKEDKPRSLAAFKIMKDMERWAKIQNRQKESVRSPSPVLKMPGGGDDQRSSKAADAAFAIFERKVSGGDDLFKKPLAPPKKEDKASKRAMGSLGLLAADYGAGSDDEEEERHVEMSVPSKSQPEDKEDKLTDWKKMACLLCRRQFPTKDALIRHQQLSDLHKQNMEIHLKIKKSKKELEALENQEKEVRDLSLNSNALISRTEPPASCSKSDCVPQLNARGPSVSPEMKRRKYQQHQHQNSWAGGSRDSHKGSERPGLGSEPVERKKKDPVAWDHATYKQAVRKAMFARFKELD